MNCESQPPAYCEILAVRHGLTDYNAQRRLQVGSQRMQLPIVLDVVFSLTHRPLFVSVHRAGSAGRSFERHREEAVPRVRKPTQVSCRAPLQQLRSFSACTAGRRERLLPPRRGRRLRRRRFASSDAGTCLGRVKSLKLMRSTPVLYSEPASLQKCPFPPAQHANPDGRIAPQHSLMHRTLVPRCLQLTDRGFHCALAGSEFRRLLESNARWFWMTA